MSRLNSYFYDIESLTNAFTLSCYRPDDQRVDIYYLVDDPALNDKDSLDFKKAAARRIREKNQLPPVWPRPLGFQMPNTSMIPKPRPLSLASSARSATLTKATRKKKRPT